MYFKKLILSLYLLIFVPLQAVEDNPDKKDLVVRMIMIETSNYNSKKYAYDTISKARLEVVDGYRGFQAAATCYSDDLGAIGGNIGNYEYSIEHNLLPEEFESVLKDLSENEVSNIVEYENNFFILTLSAEKDEFHHPTCPGLHDNQNSSSNEICGSALNNLRYQENFLKQFPTSSKRALRSARKNYLECIENFTE